MARLMLLLLVVAPMILISYAGPAQKGYIFKVSRDIYERVKVDTTKKSETFKLQQASSGKDVGDVIFDFIKNLTMIRLPEERSCFLRDSIGDVPSPADLLKLLQLARSSVNMKLTTETVEMLRVVGKLNDRSFLGSEMADLCANLPIYRVTEGDRSQNNMDQMDDQVPAKRGVVGAATAYVAKEVIKHYVCKNVCNGRKTCINVPNGVSCSWSGCKVRYRKKCYPVCRYVCKWVLTQG